MEMEISDFTASVLVEAATAINIQHVWAWQDLKCTDDGYK